MKKSRLSLAAIAALGITTASLSANNLVDIPLPSGEWKFIGVNGGFIETASDITVPSDYSGTITETLDDNASTTNGTNGTNSSTGTGVIGFTVIDHISGTSEFSSAVLNYNGSNHTYSSSATIPEMYVYVNTGDSNTTPDIRVKFQGDYEGETFYLTLGSNIYSGTFLSGATYDNAQELTVYFEQAASTASDGNLSVDYVFDRNISNNPSKPGVRGSANDYYYSSYHNDLNGTDDLRIYTYNAVNQSWETYVNKSGTVINSDFTSLEKGKGYWVKSTPYNTNNDGGLILGDTGITSSDYNASSLKAGWNMLSFNDTSLIATGSTGMIVELGIMADNNYTKFTITDTGETESFDFNSTYYMSLTTDTNKTKIVQQFNKQFAQAQAYGTLSKEFNVRAYSNGLTDANIILISDKKFRITDNGNNYSVGNVTSLSGNTLYVPSLGIKANANADINTTAVESVYGEYALGLRIPSEVADLSDNELLQTRGTIDLNGSVIPFRTTTAAIKTSVDVNATPILIDTDFNGIADTILVVGTQNFYVRDQLFSKTYAVNESVDDGALSKFILDVNQTTANQVTITTLSGADNNATSIGNKVATAADDLYFDVNYTTGYIYVDTNKTAFKTFTLEQTSGINRLRLVTDSTENNASGTVKQVYSLENLARAEVDYNSSYNLEMIHRTHSPSSGQSGNVFVEFNISNTPTSATDDLRIRFGSFTEIDTTAEITTQMTNHPNAYQITSNGFTITMDYTGQDLNISMLPADLNVTSITTKSASILADVINYHFNTGEKNSTFTISASSSSNILSVVGDINLTIDVNTTTVGEDNISISDSNLTALISDSNLTIDSITSDLKYNKVYAGAVTTDIDSAVPMIQSVAKMKVRKILGTNENASSGDISWNFIDLTKNSDSWFNAKDQYSLFSFDKTKGYWVYLEEDIPAITSFDNDLALTVDLQYDHKFINDTNDSTSVYNYTTTNVVRKGTITVDISKIADASAIDRAVARVGNNEIVLSQSGNTYTADFSEYELGSLGSKATTDINVTFFTADSFTRTISLAMDNQKPTRPEMNATTGSDLRSVAITSSSDVVFYTYSGDINDSSPASGGTFIEANVTTPFSLCAAATSFSTNVGSYRVIAVDKDEATSKSYANNIDYNRVSDIGYLDTNYSAVIYPIYKNASILNVTATATPDAKPADYDSSCANIVTGSEDNASDHAVELTSINDTAVVIAFEKNVSTFANTAPSALKLVTLAVNGNDVAKIKFDGDHYKNAGQKFLMYYNSRIYSTGWDQLLGADGGTAYFTENNKTMMTGQTIAK